ncbi:MAG TPA: alpha/beta hydrolase [Gammaproteobacteria bacterium]|nr:alpha/beta hydrolase [Gammaproteobacteria bacterium]
MKKIKRLFVIGLLALSAAAMAAPTPKTYTVGTLHVDQYGSHGRPLILIPGLGSGAWVWKETIAHFKHDHVIYALTLAGFDGTPAPRDAGNLFDAADASLLKLIRQHHIDKPVLIGHSLGGTLAIRFAEEHSDLLGGVIAADGLPVFPMFARMTDQQRQAAAQRAGDAIAHATPAQFKAQQIGFMKRVGVIDPAKAEKYGQLQARSDPAATANYLVGDASADYRPDLDKIHVPLLEIAPYYKPDYAKAVGGRPPLSQAMIIGFYERLLNGAPHAKVISIAPSRHFVMLDQPAKFRHAVAAFLGKL